MLAKNSPEMVVIICTGPRLFSFPKLANGPVVISKMEHLDPWPRAGGWQRVGALVFPPFPPLLTTDLDEPSGVGT